MKLNKIVLSTVAVLAGLSVMNTTAFAETSSQWVARTAEQVKADLQVEENGVGSYTVQWGDTLYALSVATDISIEKLAQINQIDNVNLIEVGTVFYFSEDKSIVSVEKNHQVESYSVESAETVETPLETKQVIEAQAQTATAAPEEQTTTTTATETETEQAAAPVSTKLYSLSQFMFNGVVNWNGMKFTYYSQSVLPGNGLNIPGRHVNADGYVADADGYIVLASSQPLGTVIDTPFGYQGKVYDRGTSGNHYDVYIR